MRHLRYLITLIAAVIGLATAGATMAADPPAAPAAGSRAAEALARDAVCTKCHDENDNKPILAYYQTRHGVKADPRTPGCQTCHGASDDHVRNAQGVTPRPSPEVVFGPKSKTPVEAKNEPCLTCHKSGPRSH